MSHQNYRNWNIFMEAELALLEDVGLIIDRKNFYGFSLYASEKTIAISSNFYARNADGTQYLDGEFNNTPLTIGLHIYGSTNTVIMDGEVLTSGYASAGIRVDGWKNELTINGNIRADGEYGTGLMIAYGKEHEIIHRGTITANGANGIGARFDFGDNFLGNTVEYRGSYIRTSGDVNNAALLYELDGALANTFDITGLLSGKAAAIYISPNAFVQKVNIMNGANIQGDIISDWAKDYQYIQGAAQDIMITTLTFGLMADNDGKATATPDANFSLVYSGNIISRNASMDIMIYGGTLTYSGEMFALNIFNIDSPATLAIIRKGLSPVIILAKQINFNSDNPLIINLGQDFFAYKTANGQYQALILGSEEYSGNTPTIIVNNANEVVSIGFYDYYGAQFSGSFEKTNSVISQALIKLNGFEYEILDESKTGAQAKTGALFMSLQNPAGNFIFQRTKTIEDSQMGLWIRPSYIYAKQSGKKNWSVEDINFSLGFDKKLNENIYAGIALGYDKPKFEADISDIDADIFRGAIYGVYKWKIDISAYAGFAFNDYTQNRIYANEKLNADYKGQQYEAGAQISKDYKINESVQIKPLIDYEMINLSIEDYKENSISPYALNFKNQNYLSHQIKAGVYTQYGANKFQAGIGAFYKAIAGDKVSKADVSFANDNQPQAETIDNTWQEIPESQIAIELDLKYRNKFVNMDICRHRRKLCVRFRTIRRKHRREL